MAWDGCWSGMRGQDREAQDSLVASGARGVAPDRASPGTLSLATCLTATAQVPAWCPAGISWAEGTWGTGYCATDCIFCNGSKFASISPNHVGGQSNFLSRVCTSLIINSATKRSERGGR